jgi:hypothetical protein
MDTEGHIHTGVSNVEPNELKRALLEGNASTLTEEDVGIYVSAINFLTATIDDVDHQFEKHLRALA